MKVSVKYSFENVRFYSPLRGKDYLRSQESIKDSYNEHKFSTAKSIMLRDHYDVETSDAVIVNLIGATRVSIGTVMEIAWAYAYRKPVICIIEEPEKQETGFASSSGNIHEHAMLNEAIWWRAKNIDEALDALNCLFNE
jgi:nucleoside 2-deoxyribosyltransferase